MFEVSARTTFPYRSITYIEVSWPNGSRTTGSGVVVGPNDVLTAMHVVYSSSRGGWASAVAIYPGADTKPSLVAPFGSFGNGWRISSRTMDWDVDGNGLLSDSESQYDLALIGLYERIGDTTGWVGSSSERADGAATMLGYPGRGTGLMAESVYADASSRFGVYDISSGLGAGSSGGPLLRTGANGSTYVVGVASSGDAADTTSTYAALFGPGTWEWFTQAIAGNDDLIGGSTHGAGGNAGNVDAGGGELAAPWALTKAYLAYFGRPVDFSGVTYFANRSEAEVAAAFDASKESQDLYGLDLTIKINAIYNNLFNRSAEVSGLQYWMALVTTGRISAPGAALAILAGAQGTDATAVQNKLTAADAFTRALDTPAELTGYAGLAAAQSARGFVASVNASAASLQSALGKLDAAVALAISAAQKTSTPQPGKQGVANDALADGFHGAEEAGLTLVGNAAAPSWWEPVLL